MRGCYKVFSLQQRELWLEYLNSLPVEQQDIYYHPDYLKIYQNYGDGEAQCFVFKLDDYIAIYPFLKSSINALGYNLNEEYYDIQGVYGYNGVLTNCNEELFKTAFFYAFREYCLNENIVAEFTRFNPVLKNYFFSLDNMEVTYDRKTVYCDITREKDAIWRDSYSSNNRNMIRKALKNEIEIVVSDDLTDYESFYQIYIETMDNVNSSLYLYFNRDYFMDLKRYLKDKHRLILAKYNNEVVGGMILIVYGKYAHYHLSCRKKNYGNLALNNLFLDRAISIAQEAGSELFHFGGGISSNSNDTLFKFKSNFSKDYADFFIGKKIHIQEVYDKIVSEWEEKNMEIKEKFKHFFLRYRI